MVYEVKRVGKKQIQIGKELMHIDELDHFQIGILDKIYAFSIIFNNGKEPINIIVGTEKQAKAYANAVGRIIKAIDLDS